MHHLRREPAKRQHDAAFAAIAGGLAEAQFGISDRIPGPVTVAFKTQFRVALNVCSRPYPVKVDFGRIVDVGDRLANFASWHIRDAPSHFLNVGKSPGSGHAALAAVIPAKAGTSEWCREVPAFAGMTEGSRALVQARPIQPPPSTREPSGA